MGGTKQELLEGKRQWGPRRAEGPQTVKGSDSPEEKILEG